MPQNLDALNFNVYGPSSSVEDATSSKRRRLLVAETHKMEYVSEPEHPNCRYVIGIPDPKTGRVTLHETESVRFTSNVKALKQGPSKIIGEKNILARNQLGEAFGTRKRRLAIHAVVANKVDVAGLQDVASKISEKIQETSLLMPTKDQITADMAALPQDVYPL
eukprot:jgi/Hompol1/4618/HPOL_003750-RA